MFCITCSTGGADRLQQVSCWVICPECLFAQTPSRAAYPAQAADHLHDDQRAALQFIRVSVRTHAATLARGGQQDETRANLSRQITVIHQCEKQLNITILDRLPPAPEVAMSQLRCLTAWRLQVANAKTKHGGPVATGAITKDLSAISAWYYQLKNSRLPHEQPAWNKCATYNPYAGIEWTYLTKAIRKDANAAAKPATMFSGSDILELLFTDALLNVSEGPSKGKRKATAPSVHMDRLRVLLMWGLVGRDIVLRHLRWTGRYSPVTGLQPGKGSSMQIHVAPTGAITYIFTLTRDKTQYITIFRDEAGYHRGVVERRTAVIPATSTILDRTYDFGQLITVALAQHESTSHNPDSEECPSTPMFNDVDHLGEGGKLAKRCATALGKKDPSSFVANSFRHTFMTSAFNAGVADAELMKNSRHSTQQSARIYMASDVQRCVNVFDTALSSVIRAAQDGVDIMSRTLSKDPWPTRR